MNCPPRAEAQQQAPDMHLESNSFHKSKSSFVDSVGGHYAVPLSFLGNQLPDLPGLPTHQHTFIASKGAKGSLGEIPLGISIPPASRTSLT